ncbi:MAG: NADH-quinone oxidoreductase subunit M [Deltaproteobacteria bacterium]|nr:NADH-quinone oxidoreductase subunit M [Deltaproteobacteria bacterium]
MRRLVVLAFALFATLFVAAFSSRAEAQDSRRAGTVRLEGVGGGHGPVDLKPSREGLSGELAIVNEGKEPLVVSRIAVRGDAADPRSPAKVTARIADGVLPVTIAPGATRKAIVTWVPEKTLRVHQLFGHVVVTTSDETSGEVAMGVRAQNGGLLGPLESHVLSAIIGVPLLGAFVTFLLRLLGRRDDKTPHVVATIALAVQAALAIYVYRGFLPDVSRIDGNDGLQFIEHGVWIRALSIELFFGVDGTNAVTILVTSLVAFFAMLPERTLPREGAASGYHAAYLILAAAVPGALAAMDGIVFVVFAATSVIAAALLVGGWGAEGRREAATRLGLLGGVAVVLLLIVVITVGKNADPTFLVDGTKTSTTFSMPELARMALGAKGAKLFGVTLVKVAFLLVLIATLVLLGAFPLHGWLTPTLLVSPSSTGALVSAALPSIGVCALLRLGCAVLPEGMRWASGVVVALGAVSAAYGALGALGQTDLRRLAAYASTSQIGFVLLGAGSLTPQGLSGAMVLASTRALSVALFVILIGAVEDRARTRDIEKLAGVASQMPGWATALAAAALAQAGVLGLGGAWGPMLALLGALPNYPPLALLGSVALVVTAGAHFHALSRVVFGKLLPDWEKSPFLEPFGGRFPDLTAREWTTIAPLATLVVVLGVWPAPVFATTTGTVRDLTNAVSPPGPEQIALAE